VHGLKNSVRNFVDAVHEGGRTIWGCGASTKGNTLLQYFGLDSTKITAIGERQPQKWGLRTVGTDIPIVSEDEMRAAHPDYLLVLPWHFQREIVARERAYLERGGQLVFPCPEFEIVGG
jgi:NDP-4-keto-2,6-dideoxyhexose 3-C-methyltransferase